MKKIIQLLCIGIILFMISCKKDTGNEINPLAFLSFLGDSTLTVTATYNGTAAEVGASGKIYVYLYSSLGITTRDPAPVYTGSTDAAVTIGSPATITIPRIVAGEYYVFAFYDYHTGDNPDNQTDRYVLYSGTAYTSGASKVTISGETNLDMGTFGDTNVLAASSAFMTTTTYTVTVPVTYTGTISTDDYATKMLYVYLYSTLGATTRTPALPVRTGISLAVASSGVQQNIAVSNVVPGNYYVLAFYDASAGANPDSVTDPYAFFVNTQYTANAQKVVISGDTTLPAMDIGETNVLQSGGAYLTPSSTYTLTVNAAYTGTRPDDTRTMYVYLYSVLGTATRNQYLPIYTGVSSAVSSTSPYAITVSSVIPGSYYVLVFYNYNSSGANPDNQNDRYRLYDNAVPAGTRCRSEADSFTVSSDGSISDISIDKTYYLRSGAAYETSGCP